MHIGIFAERFTGRYGADRVLVIIAEQLRARGHQVTLIGCRFSRVVAERFTGHTFTVPTFGDHEPEERTLAWFQDVQYFLHRHLPPFDLCVVGSFPFILAIPYLKAISRGVVFIDFGVVPTAGLPAESVKVIDQVLAHRRAALPQTNAIVSISDFITRTQALPESQGKAPVHTILLGADHLALGLGNTQGAPFGHQGKTYTRQILDGLRDCTKKLILALGRWEPGTYKNSEAAFAVLRSLLDYDPNVMMLLIADPGHVQVPTDLAYHVTSLGFPTDPEMDEVVRRIDAGLSVSTWEGFNLPLAELQYQEKEVFALNLAAHPEVAVVPEQLCADAEDMALKIFFALRNNGTPSWVRSGAVAGWREQFSWQRFGNDFTRVVEDAA